MKEHQEHLTREELEELMAADLSGEGCRSMMEHIASCSFCAERFAGLLENETVPPPAYLKDEILERTRSLEVQTAKTVYTLSKKTRFYLYSLKVGFALAASLYLLFFRVPGGLSLAGTVQEPVSFTETVREKGSRAGKYLRDLGIRIWNMDDKEADNE